MTITINVNLSTNCTACRHIGEKLLGESAKKFSTPCGGPFHLSDVYWRAYAKQLYGGRLTQWQVPQIVLAECADCSKNEMFYLVNKALTPANNYCIINNKFILNASKNCKEKA